MSQPLEEIQDQIVERLHAGEPLDREAVLHAHPEHAAALEAFLDLLGEIEGNEEPDAPAPSRLGEFIIVRELGRGGMGVVYEAEQKSLGRRVALKVLPPALVRDKRLIARFRREAQAAGRLRHPGIVPVYSFGEVAGTPFFAMELVAGRSLAQIIEARRRGEDAGLPPDGEAWRCWSVEAAARIADALAYAHGRGILHRDVKPGNVLIDEHGTPRLTDFGLALDLWAEGLTLSGEVFGSPQYMSPEQAFHRKLAVDERTDVYSLGVTLYEMLTLRLPYAGDTGHEYLAALEQGNVIPPRAADPEIPETLERVLLRTLENDAAERYASAAELANDLRAFLEGQPLAAAPAPRRVHPGHTSEVPERAAREGIEASGLAAAAMKAGWVLGIAVVFGAGAWGARAIFLRRSLDRVDKGHFVDIVVTCLGVMGFAFALVGMCRSLLVKRERALGIDAIVPVFERAWILPGLALVACLELMYAGNATQNTALTESMWMSGPFLLLVTGLMWQWKAIERWRRRAGWSMSRLQRVSVPLSLVLTGGAFLGIAFASPDHPRFLAGAGLALLGGGLLLGLLWVVRSLLLGRRASLAFVLAVMIILACASLMIFGGMLFQQRAASREAERAAAPAWVTTSDDGPRTVHALADGTLSDGAAVLGSWPTLTVGLRRIVARNHLGRYTCRTSIPIPPGLDGDILFAVRWEVSVAGGPWKPLMENPSSGGWQRLSSGTLSLLAPGDASWVLGEHIDRETIAVTHRATMRVVRGDPQPENVSEGPEGFDPWSLEGGTTATSVQHQTLLVYDEYPEDYPELVSGTEVDEVMRAFLTPLEVSYESAGIMGVGVKAIYLTLQLQYQGGTVPVASEIDVYWPGLDGPSATAEFWQETDSGPRASNRKITSSMGIQFRLTQMAPEEEARLLLDLESGRLAELRIVVRPSRRVALERTDYDRYWAGTVDATVPLRPKDPGQARNDGH